LADAAFYVYHEEPLGKLPDQWSSYWKDVVSPQAAHLYEILSADDFASKEVDLTRIARYLGMSKSRFAKAVAELEEHGMARLDADDSPPSVTLRPVPEVDPDAPPVEKKRGPISSWRPLWEFVNYWADLHDRHLEELYPRPRHGSRNGDTHLVDEMLRTYSLETLKKIAHTFFTKRRNDEPATITYFHYRLPRLISEYKDTGGSVLPKLRKEA
jgi:hypothetical protein